MDVCVCVTLSSLLSIPSLSHLPPNLPYLPYLPTNINLNQHDPIYLPGLNSKISLITTLMDHDSKLAKIVEEVCTHVCMYVYICIYICVCYMYACMYVFSVSVYLLCYLAPNHLLHRSFHYPSPIYPPTNNLSIHNPSTTITYLLT